ncbi:unnamed protein product [Calypogeia fissa]
MAFHLACPLTCRKICYCSFGRTKDPSPSSASQTSLQQILKKDIWPSLDFLDGEKTVDVVVPCLLKDVKKSNKQQRIPTGGKGASKGDHNNAEDGGPAPKRPFRGKKMKLSSTTVVEVTPSSEVSTKKASRLTIVRRSASAIDVNSIANRSERGTGANSRGGDADLAGGAQGVDRHGRHEGGAASAAQELSREPHRQTVCGICSSAETVGGDREKRMLLCRSCNGKYHRKCVKRWAEFRDLFDWTQWVCGSCRACEVCRQAGDPNKLMYCKRCDEGFHIYCQQPPLKNVPKGPYLCPKHTVCHSCDSNVPGSGVSSRWFMAFTTCDACGRLFVKDKYCPVCLKVYRDSEVTPMVCCDSCEHWVHCWCDGISDEQFFRYQNDDNLRYVCAACRGECHKVENVEDAVQELWKRRDEKDADLRSKLRAAAGLPSPEEMEEFIPSSDDERPLLSASRGSGHTSSRPANTRTPTGRFGSDDTGAFTSGKDKQDGSVRKKIIVRNNPKMMSSNSRSLGGTPTRNKSIASSS